MPVLLLPCSSAKLVRKTPPSAQPAWRQRDPHHRAWLPAPQCAAEGAATARQRPGEGQMRPQAAAMPAAERSRHAWEAGSTAAEVMANAAASSSNGAAWTVPDGLSAQHAAGSQGGGATAPSAEAPAGDEDGASWQVRGRASSYSAPETQQSPAPPPPPKLLVFSGGTAFNSVAGEVLQCFDLMNAAQSTAGLATTKMHTARLSIALVIVGCGAALHSMKAATAEQESFTAWCDYL